MKRYIITRKTVRGPRGWHWCIDVTVGKRRTNWATSRPYRFRLLALWHLYRGKGWQRWVLCHRAYQDFQSEGIL